MNIISSCKLSHPGEHGRLVPRDKMFCSSPSSHTLAAILQQAPLVLFSDVTLGDDWKVQMEWKCDAINWSSLSIWQSQVSLIWEKCSLDSACVIYDCISIKTLWHSIGDDFFVFSLLLFLSFYSFRTFMILFFVFPSQSLHLSVLESFSPFFLRSFIHFYLYLLHFKTWRYRRKERKMSALLCLKLFEYFSETRTQLNYLIYPHRHASNWVSYGTDFCIGL